MAFSNMKPPSLKDNPVVDVDDFTLDLYDDLDYDECLDYEEETAREEHQSKRQSDKPDDDAPASKKDDSDKAGSQNGNRKNEDKTLTEKNDANKNDVDPKKKGRVIVIAGDPANREGAAVEVANLPPTLMDNELEKLFSLVGKVKQTFIVRHAITMLRFLSTVLKCDVLKNRKTGICRGKGYVIFPDKEAALKAISKFNGAKQLGSQTGLEVRYATSTDHTGRWKPPTNPKKIREREAKLERLAELQKQATNFSRMYPGQTNMASSLLQYASRDKLPEPGQGVPLNCRGRPKYSTSTAPYLPYPENNKNLKPPWMDQEYVKERAKRKRLQKHPDKKAEYNKQKRFCQYLARSKKKAYYLLLKEKFGVTGDEKMDDDDDVDDDSDAEDGGPPQAKKAKKQQPKDEAGASVAEAINKVDRFMRQMDIAIKKAREEESKQTSHIAQQLLAAPMQILAAQGKMPQLLTEKPGHAGLAKKVIPILPPHHPMMAHPFAGPPLPGTVPAGPPMPPIPPPFMGMNFPMPGLSGDGLLGPPPPMPIMHPAALLPTAPPGSAPFSSPMQSLQLEKKCVFIYGLEMSTNSEELKNLFQPFGLISSVKKTSDKKFGFVEYTTESAALSAVRAMNGASFGNLKLQVSIKTKK